MTLILFVFVVSELLSFARLWLLFRCAKVFRGVAFLNKVEFEMNILIYVLPTFV